MKTEQLIEKYLVNEYDMNKVGDIKDEVEGLKGWLDDFEKIYSSGKFRDAQRAIEIIKRRLIFISRSF